MHRMMMKMVVGSIAKKKEEKLTDDDRAMLRSADTKVDYTDTAATLPLIEYVSKLK